MQDDGLFADPRPVDSVAEAPDPEALPDWQVAALRKSLDQLGVITMAERQALVAELAGRQVSSLRDLTFPEARAVSEALTARMQRSSTTGSPWDNRDEDTWIDKL